MAGAAKALAHPAANRTLAGIALLVAAVACFAVLDTTTKFVSLSVPVLMALWFRYAFQALATTVAVLPKRGWALLRTAHPRFQCLRGVLLLNTSLLAFFSLKYMPVGEFTAIVMITPLLITLLASLTLGERVSALRWALVTGGFAGTLVIIRPGGEGFDWTMLLPLGLVVSHAWFQILTSRLARTEDPFTMQFYTGWVGALITSLALPFVWTSLDSWTLWAGLCLMGLMGTVGHFMMILAYARAPVSALTP
ncbi:MAG: DMT family transporter, partial [Polaromonas sp.]|nr:DMT family transporter [Polaromonas sp.]